MPAARDNDSVLDYEIGPLDKISVRVFQEPDLSLDQLQVDAAGNIFFPLIGQVRASGQTSSSLSQEIAEKLKRYLVNPQVSTTVVASVSQKVTVDGQVSEPGVYELQGQTTLLQALAMAKGPTRIAKLDEIIIFRTMGNERYAARFNLKDIREGRADDPKILGNDTVIVGMSQAKSIYRDFLSMAPLLTTLFVRLY